MFSDGDPMFGAAVASGILFAVAIGWAALIESPPVDDADHLWAEAVWQEAIGDGLGFFRLSGLLAVDGDLSRSAVHGTLVEHASEFERCGSGAHTTVQFVVNPDGVATRRPGQPHSGGAFFRCVRWTIEKMRFPTSAGPTAVNAEIEVAPDGRFVHFPAWADGPMGIGHLDRPTIARALLAQDADVRGCLAQARRVWGRQILIELRRRPNEKLDVWVRAAGQPVVQRCMNRVLQDLRLPGIDTWPIRIRVRHLQPAEPTEAMPQSQTLTVEARP